MPILKCSTAIRPLKAWGTPIDKYLLTPANLVEPWVLRFLVHQAAASDSCLMFALEWTATTNYSCLVFTVVLGGYYWFDFVFAVGQSCNILTTEWYCRPPPHTHTPDYFKKFQNPHFPTNLPSPQLLVGWLKVTLKCSWTLNKADLEKYTPSLIYY